MVEDTPDDLVHEIFTQGFWEDHPLGRPILGTKETVESFTQRGLRDYFRNAYTPRNLIVSAVGNLEHQQLRDLVNDRFGDLASVGEVVSEEAPRVVPKIQIRNKELEQSHVCLGASSYPQDHDDRYSSYVLNTLLGGSMSSRLFQNVREKRGLAYAVFSGLAAYRDAGSFTVYAGCSNDVVGEVIDLVVEELKTIKQTPVPMAELQRAKDHLKGSLMLSLENTASRMSHLARQEIYFDRQFGLDETLQGVERVTADDVQRVATRFVQEWFARGDRVGQRERFRASADPTRFRITTFTTTRTHGGNRAVVDGAGLCVHRVLRGGALTDDPRYTHPEMGRIWSDQRRYETWLLVETAAAEAMAAAGMVPAEAARDIRERGAFDIARIEDDRTNNPARRHRLHHGGCRARRSFRALAAFRPDLVGCRRHRAGPADARGLRRHPEGSATSWRRRSATAPSNIGARR